MAERSGIAHRYSYFQPGGQNGARATRWMPTVSTGWAHFRARPNGCENSKASRQGWRWRRSRNYWEDEDRSRITHLVVTSCTGFSAPGIDLALVERCGLNPSIERTMVGFMGCYAAINALKLARHIVRSEPKARVLAVNLELCTLHLHETADLEEILSFLLFADGCAAALVSADPIGVGMQSFQAALVPDTRELIRWHIREQGFDMVLSGAVPGAIRTALTARATPSWAAPTISILWAVHPGGRTVLDAVEEAFALPPAALSASRSVLHDYGNMSSGTVMFVLDRIMRAATGAASAAAPCPSAPAWWPKP